MTPLFHLENIVRTYPDPASRDPHAVRTVLNLSELDIRAGEILGIRGHNGSGKSTLLRIIALLEPPDSGTVLTVCASGASATPPSFKTGSPPLSLPWASIPPFSCIAAAMSFPAGNASVWPSPHVWPCAPEFF